MTTYDHVIVLGYTDNMSAQSADTRTLVTLLQLRQLSEAAGRHVNVVSEMLDARNRALAEVTRADDFVVSNQLVSLMLAQASENKYISAIFADLLDEDGSEVYIRPVTDYVASDQPVSFYTIIEAARRAARWRSATRSTVGSRRSRKHGRRGGEPAAPRARRSMADGFGGGAGAGVGGSSEAALARDGALGVGSVERE